MQGCAVVNLSFGPSRLVLPRVSRKAVASARSGAWCPELAAEALALEAELGYLVPSSRYWEEAGRFDPLALDRLDALWLQAATLPLRQTG